MKYSVEQLTRIISAVFLVLGLFGFKSEVSIEDLVTSLNGIVIGGSLVIGLVANIVGYFRRYFKGDVNIFGGRI